MNDDPRALALSTCVLLMFALTGPLGNPVAATDDWIGEVVELANKRCDQPTNPNLPGLSPSFYEPKNLTDTQKAAIVLEGIRTERTAKRRLCCLKILVERFPLTAIHEIESIASNGSLDIEIRKRAIWIAGFVRDESSIVWLEKLLNSMEPSIRVAAIDALGFTLFPYYLDKFQGNNFHDPLGVNISGEVPIFVSSVFKYGATKKDAFSGLNDKTVARKLVSIHVGKNQLAKRGDERTRTRIAKHLMKTMLRGRTDAERIAAARALSGYQPTDYELRVAEWGVWVEADGKLQLVQSVLDEIPPVAYQTTKRIAELKKRVNQIMIVTKPIVHLTVNRPLSVDVCAFIRKGQPWFTYPQPSCFEIEVNGSPNDSEFTDTDFQETKNLAEAKSNKWNSFGQQAHQGYPFLLPKASMVGGFGGRFGSMNRLQSIGVRWQHLIVVPKQLDWMVEPIVEREYSWWSDLRKVKSSWVSNGFESEKFLYYDGPTILPSPVRIERSGEGENVEWMIRYFGVLRKAEKGDNSVNEEKPIGLLVEVKDGKIRGRKIDFDYAFDERKRLNEVKKQLNFGDVNCLRAKLTKSSVFDMKDGEVQRELLLMLTKNKGLNASEAQGLVNAWQKQFFETDGKRIIVRIRKHDYDFQCPLKVTPKPTQISRVGLILSELDE